MYKKGFTLAEVLITLGVIGVVSAMTLPTLIKEYQKHVWVNQLKKSYSLLEQAFQKMMVDDGVQKISDTSMWAIKGDSNNCIQDSYLNDGSVCRLLIDSYKKYLKIINVEKYGKNIAYLRGKGYVLSNSNAYFVLSDGTMFYLTLNVRPNTKTEEQCNQIKSLGGNLCSTVGTILIDINGKKSPNTYGRDIFQFSLSDDGKLHPYSGINQALHKSQTALDNNTKYWRKTTSFCGTHDSSEIPNNTKGDGCAARIIENGWKMDY